MRNGGGRVFGKRAATILAGLLGAALVAPGAALAADRAVNMRFNQFQPNRVQALTGERVVWTNLDATAHNVTAPSFSSPNLSRSEMFAHTFSTAGVFGYRCTLHGGMSGTVVVAQLHLAGPAAPILAPRAARLTGLAPANSSVTIHRVGGEQVGAVMAGADGRFTASIAGVPGRYYAVSAERTSANVRVAVRPRMTIAQRRVAGRVAITVKTNRPQAGTNVVLERRKGAGWARIARTRLNARSQATVRIARPKTAIKVRARVVKGVAGYAPAVSQVITVRR